MDFNKIIARAKAILLTPKTEWPVIVGEPTTVADLYRNYIVVLAAVPAVFTFLKMSLIGVSVPFAGTVRIGIGAGLSQMVLGYVLTLVMVYVMAFIIDMLAPSFGGQKDRVQALKTVAYAYTAGWVAGIAAILPWLGTLIGIAGLIYGIYLLYLGLPHTMKCPQDKAGGYTAVAIIIAIVLGFCVFWVVGTVTGVRSYMGGGNWSSSTRDSDDVELDKDSPLGKLEQWSKNVEEAGKKMEAAEKSGDQKAHSEAMKQMMGAALGGGKVEALPPERIKSFVPESFAGLQRSSFSSERNNAMGMQISEAKATYSNDAGRSVRLEITDMGSAKGMLALAGWAGVEGEKESDHGYEKTYRTDGRLVHEQWDNSSSSGEYAVVLGDRFTVKVEGEADSIDDLKSAFGDLDLSGLEALKDEGVAKN